MCLVLGELGDCRRGHRSKGRDSKESLSEDALRVEKVDKGVGSMHRDVVGGLLSSLVGSCGSGRGDIFARIPHCGHMSCRCSQQSTIKC